MKSFWMGILVIGFSLAASDLCACPSGQTCPAGKDCVADSSLCVASSSSTSSGGTSSEPTTTKDQLGLTLMADPNLEPIFRSRALVSGSGKEDIGLETSLSINYWINSRVEADVNTSFLFTSDLIEEDSKNASIPDDSGWIWGDAPNPKF